ncbi:MAG: hypothetical protein Q4D77_02495 [Peptostreptococcaceae bacterium]|nr:hypothetical protein [Peptostreptococcaceae bacterium]
MKKYRLASNLYYAASALGYLAAFIDYIRGFDDGHRFITILSLSTLFFGLGSLLRKKAEENGE